MTISKQAKPVPVPPAIGPQRIVPHWAIGRALALGPEVQVPPSEQREGVRHLAEGPCGDALHIAHHRDFPSGPVDRRIEEAVHHDDKASSGFVGLLGPILPPERWLENLYLGPARLWRHVQ